MPEASSSPRFRVGPFLVATAASAGLVLSAPFIGEIRRAILTRFPEQGVRILGGIVLAAVAAALVIAVARIRDRRAPRYAAIAAALAIGVGYALASRTGNPQVDAVELFHFVEYGLITLLFYRAWRPAGDLSVLVLPLLAGLLVGTFEEWFQWLIPARIGEMRDVFLNGVAIACGLIFSAALEPPERLSTSLTAGSLRRIGLFAAVTLIVFAAFVHSVHVGYTIRGSGWSFRSCYTSGELDALAADRASRWRDSYVDRPKRLSIEDQYMTEGLWHVQRRNLAWTAGDAAAAWNENLILERYFAPVLDTPSYVSRALHRWPAAQRADAEARAAASAGPGYQSDAHPSAIYDWPKAAYWTLTGIAALALGLPFLRHAFRRRPVSAAAG